MKKEFTRIERLRIAKKVGVSEPYLYQCLTGRRDMNPEEAVRIEIESSREITRFDLCHKTGRGIWPELAPPTEPAPATEPAQGV